MQVLCAGVQNLYYNTNAHLTSVSDIKALLTNVWSTPTLSAHLAKGHDYAVASLHAATNPVKPKKRVVHPELNNIAPEAALLQRSIDATILKSWPYVFLYPLIDFFF